MAMFFRRTSDPAPMTLHGVVEMDETGTFVASVVEMPGCVSQGTTPEDAMTNLLEALQGYVVAQIHRAGRSAIEQSIRAGDGAPKKKEFELALA